ncbi:hypothetical protein Tco_1067322 [Tanacetum coccineum]|uniref:Uncharacterized protein n=1 Tax=Tanacetum coccineum TaxID=301880 RepID=A0ABQ5HEC0_9ASTR
MTSLLKILRYLHGMVEHGMLIRHSSGSTLQGFTDVLWKAEYKALADTVADLTWLQALLNELGINSSSTPILWTSPISSLTLPVRKRYRGTSELILDTDNDEGHGLGDEDHGLDDESQGLEDEGLGLEEEEAAPEGQQQAVLVVDTAVSEPLDIDRDVRELYTRSGAVRDEIFSQRYRFRSLEREQERATVTFRALWRLVLALEAWAGRVDTGWQICHGIVKQKVNQASISGLEADKETFMELDGDLFQLDILHQENDDVLYDNNDQEEPVVIQDVDVEVVEMDHVVEET